MVRKALIAGTMLLQGCWLFASKPPRQNSEDTGHGKAKQEVRSTDSDSPIIHIADETVGTGKEALVGTKLSVQYSAALESGIVFDSSFQRGQPFSFVLGEGQVVEGWERGLLGMKVGGKRKLVVPPEFAYGHRGLPGVVPPDTTLTFVIELLSVE